MFTPDVNVWFRTEKHEELGHWGHASAVPAVGDVIDIGLRQKCWRVILRAWRGPGDVVLICEPTREWWV